MSAATFGLLVFIHALLVGLLYYFPTWKRLKKGGLWTLKASRVGDKLFYELSTKAPGLTGFSPPDWKDQRLQYKFYPLLIKELVELNQKWGTPLKGPWSKLKRDLHLDLKWQKKAESIVAEALFQQGTMSAFVLLFAWSFESLSPKRPSLLPELFCFYSLGLFLLGLLSRFLEKRALGEGALLWSGLIRLEIFTAVKLSVQETLSKSKLQNFLQGRDKDFFSVRQILGEALEAYQQFGRPLGETLEDLRQEYSFIVEQKMALLLKHLKLVQVGMALLFVLPSFFYLISVHINQFLFE